MESLLEEKKTGQQQRAQLKSDDIEENLIKSLPGESNAQDKNEHLGKRLKKLYFEDKVGNQNELYTLGKTFYHGYITLKEF